MTKLMRSVSGIRGVMGDTLNPIVLMEYLNAFLQLTQAKKIVIGRDSRPTGESIENLVCEACCAAGVESIRLGLATTPTVEMMVPYLKADAGIIVTASHNPIEWNALKFLNREGIFLKESEVEALFKLVDEKKFVWAPYHQYKSHSSYPNANQIHIEQTLQLPYINVSLIQSKKFKVGYDAVNGAGSLIIPELLKRLGCEVVPLYTEPNGLFPRGAEPTPENLQDLGQTVKTHQCAVGFATDPDGDRCALVDENGVPPGEEYTLALAVKLFLKHKKGPITINLSTSRMIEDLAEEYGVPVHRAKVGEINVTEKMQANGSVIGGEGNGGVILPELHYGRDGVLAVALILQLLAETGKTLSELVATIPSYHMEKIKIPIVGKSLNHIYGKLLAKFANLKLNQEDGLRFEWERKWVHIRASNTEPIIRVIAEAPSEPEAKQLCQKIMAEV